MQSDILKKIDVLVEMTGSSMDIDTLNAEVNEIEKESNKLSKELSHLNDSESNNKYFKASEKLVDENIKASLESKIRKEENSINELQSQIESIDLEESKLHDIITSLKEEISASQNYIDVLNDRIATITDSTSLNSYKEILEKEDSRLEELKSSLDQKEQEYASVLEKLNYLFLAKDEIQIKLDRDNDRLEETESSLINSSSYVDKELEKIDKDRIEEIKENLTNLDKRRIEIITDPAMIADEAKKLILSDDRENAISKIKELVTIVKTKPYMDLPNNKDLKEILQEELENASNKRDEFASLIDSKDYRIIDSEAIVERIQYLNVQIADYEEKIRTLNEEIKTLETNDFVILNEKLNNAVQLASDLEKNLKEYEKIIAEDEEKTPKRRAVLNSAFQKKQKDLENIKMVIDNYRKDQKSLIQRTHKIEVVDIVAYEDLIKNIKNEIEILNAILSDTNSTKDVLAIENDKLKLKELDETVKTIKHRQKYDKTPSELFDEIEIYLGSMHDEVIVKEALDQEKIQESDVSEKNSNIDEETIPVLVDDKKDTEKDLDNNILVTPEINDLPKTIKIEELDENSLDNLADTVTVMHELPELADVDTPSEKQNVINIEPVINSSDSVEAPIIENPFVIGDYKNDTTIEDVDNVLDNEN